MLWVLGMLRTAYVEASQQALGSKVLETSKQENADWPECAGDSAGPVAHSRNSPSPLGVVLSTFARQFGVCWAPTGP